MRTILSFLKELLNSFGFRKRHQLELETKRAKGTHTLSKKEREVQDRAWKYLNENINSLIQKYTSLNGNILDADRAKDLFPEYADNIDTRREYASAVYEPAQQIVDKIFLNAVSSKDAKDRIVILTAGGPGTGKSSFLVSMQQQFTDALVVMDGTLADRGRAYKNIDLALKHGALVAVYYMHRPFDEAINGVIDRALSPTSGRTVPLRVAACKYYGASHTIQSLARDYGTNPRVLLEIKKFTGIGLAPGDSSLGEVIKMTPKSIDRLIKKAYLILDERYRSAQRNKIFFPEETYKRLASNAPSFKSPHR